MALQLLNDATFAGDVTVEGSHLKILNHAGAYEGASTDYLYIGGNGLDGANGAIYLGNAGDDTGYGWRFLYLGSGSGNNNKLIIRSENAGSGVDALSFTQDGNATFAATIYASGNNSVDWSTAYQEARQWDGGNTNLNAAAGRVSLEATTIGDNMFTLANPGAITFPRFNADNTISPLAAAPFRNAIGAAAYAALANYLPLSAGSGEALTGDLYGTNANFSGTVTATDLLTVNGDGHLFLGATGEAPKIDMLYTTNASGRGWDTRIFTGRTDDLPNAQSFPTSTIAGGFGTQYQANSDGAFFGIIPYATGHYRPVINWGDDADDTPFSFQFNGTNIVDVSSTGTVTATNFIGSSGAFLPLAAGAGSPLTGNLVINSTSSAIPVLLLNAAGNANCDITMQSTNTSSVTRLRTGVNDFQIHTNGSQQVTVNSAGNVGIGTDNPLNRLFVTAATAGDYAGFIENTNATNGYGLVARTAHTATSAYAFAARAGTSDIFVVRGDGNVGIGTTSPDAKLEITTIRESGIRLSSSDITAVTDELLSGIDFYSPDTGNEGIKASIKVNYADNAANSYMTFGTGTNVERMRIEAGGNVGIGTDSPNAILNIASDDSTFTSLLLDNENTADAGTESTEIKFRLYRSYVPGLNDAGKIILGKEQAWDGADDRRSYMSFANRSGSAGVTEKMRINSAGNVGIGTDNPGRKLEVSGVTKTAGFQNTDSYIEDILYCSFANGVANQNFDIQFGNTSFWGYIEVEITGAYTNQNTPGKLTKLYAVGTNPGTIYTNESRVSDSLGFIKDNISLGDFRYDNTTGSETFAIRVSHIRSSGNPYNIKVKAFTRGNGANTILNNLTMSSVYTQTALPRNYVYYNDNVGIGTTSPTAAKLVVDSDTAPQILVKNSGGGNSQILFEDNSGGTQNASITYDQAGENALYITTSYDSPTDGNRIYLQPGGETAMTLIGGNNATGNAGNVGIGTTDPSDAKLKVLGNVIFDGHNSNDPDSASRTAYPADQMFTHYDNNGVSIIGGAGGYSGVGLTIGEETGRSNEFKFIRGVSDTNGGANAAEEFWVNGIGGAYFAGNVGIGTDSPSANLEIESASNPEISIASTGGATSNYLNFKATSHTQPIQSQIKTVDNNDFTADLAFSFKQTGTGGALTERMRIEAGGNVGIGVTSVSTGVKLEVDGTIKSTSTGSAHLILNGDSNNSGDTGNEDAIIDLLADGDPGLYGYRINTENWSGQTALNFKEYLNGSYTSRLFISKIGNVGIGTTNPDSKLHVSSANSVVTIEATTNGQNCSTWYKANGNNQWETGCNISSGQDYQIYDRLNSASRMVVGHNGNVTIPGNVGIGTTSPTQAKLCVSGSTFQTGDLLLAEQNTYSPEIKMTNSTHTIGIDYQNNETLRFITRSGATTVPITFQMRAGTITAANFILSSDERKKTKVKDLSRDSISVNWKSFEMKENEGEYRAGVIAQELEEKHPEFVRTDDEGMKSVAYIDLLIAKIAELEARLEKAGI